MAFRSTYTGRYTGMGNMLRQPWMLSAVLPVAHKAMVVAQGLSPTGHFPEDKHPGQYRASFEVNYGLKPKKFRGRPAKRMTATVVNRAPHAGIVEYGNGKTPEYRVLRNMIDAMKAAHGA